MPAVSLFSFLSFFFFWGGGGGGGGEGRQPKCGTNKSFSQPVSPVLALSISRNTRVMRDRERARTALQLYQASVSHVSQSALSCNT